MDWCGTLLISTNVENSLFMGCFHGSPSICIYDFFHSPPLSSNRIAEAWSSVVRLSEYQKAKKTTTWLLVIGGKTKLSRFLWQINKFQKIAVTSDMYHNDLLHNNRNSHSYCCGCHITAFGDSGATHFILRHWLHYFCNSAKYENIQIT